MNQVTRDLFQAARTPQTMAKLGQEKVLDIIRPLGLAPKKSRYLVSLSKQVGHFLVLYSFLIDFLILR